MMCAAAPRQLARLFLRPFPQPMNGHLETSGRMERIEFAGEGGARCRGWWVRPIAGQAASDRCVILAHGWSAHALRMQNFVDPLVQAGYQVMLYSARSHGDSDWFPYCSLIHFAEDVEAAVTYARNRAPEVAVLGHSMGAAGALVAAADGAPVAAVVALAPPCDQEKASIEILNQQGLRGKYLVHRIKPFVESMVGRAFHDAAPEDRIGEVNCPVLIGHGEADEVVPIDHFHRLRRLAGPNVEAYTVRWANHDGIRTADETLGRLQGFLERVFPAQVAEIDPGWA